MATKGQDVKESLEKCVFYTLESDLESWKRLQLQVTIQTERADGSRLHDGSRMPSCILDFGDEAHAMIMQTAHKVPLNDWVCILPPCGSDPSNASVVFDAATRQIVASQYAERFNESQGSYLCVIKVCERHLQELRLPGASSRQKLPHLMRGFDMSMFLMEWARACPGNRPSHFLYIECVLSRTKVFDGMACVRRIVEGTDHGVCSIARLEAGRARQCACARSSPLFRSRTDSTWREHILYTECAYARSSPIFRSEHIVHR